MTTACCKRRRNDGIVDDEEVRRAVAGQSATLSPAELNKVVWELSHRRQWGLKKIAHHTGYSNSHIGAILAQQKGTEQGGRT